MIITSQNSTISSKTRVRKTQIAEVVEDVAAEVLEGKEAEDVVEDKISKAKKKVNPLQPKSKTGLKMLLTQTLLTNMNQKKSCLACFRV